MSAGMLRAILFFAVTCMSTPGYASGAGVPAGAQARVLPEVSAAAVRAGKEAAGAIFARGAVAAAEGGGGYYLDQVEESLSTLANVTLLRISDDVLLVRLDPRDLFDRRSTILHVAGNTLLGNMAEKLRFFPKAAIVVQVHADSGSGEEHNVRLTERRVKSIVDHLEGFGLEQKRMAGFGYGDRYPLSSGPRARVNILLRTR